MKSPDHVHRLRIPLLIAVITPAAILVLWETASAESQRDIRVVISYMIAMLGMMLMLSWYVLFGPGTRRRRWTTGLSLLGLVAVFFTLFRFEFSGDMVFRRISFRWSRHDDHRLEEHRQNTEATPASETIVLDSASPTSFPAYRGHHRDGIVLEGPPLEVSQPPTSITPLWRQPIGGGYSQFAVAGNTLITIEQRRGSEAIVAYDRVSGAERWKFEYPAYFQEALGGNGPRATPTIDGNDVFSLGATGVLVCLDGRTGAMHWTRNILEDAGSPNLTWGMSGSPLVWDNAVIVNPGCNRPDLSGKAVAAYDRKTGEILWQTGDAPAGYSSPMRATLAGKDQILLFDGRGLVGIDPVQHKELWRFPWQTSQDINVSQPLVLEGDRVYISSAYDKGGAMLRITQEGEGLTAKPIWENKNLRCKFTSPVLGAGSEYIYGLDMGILVCLDAKTGERTWKRSRQANYGHGQLLRSGDQIVVMAESGELAVVSADPKEFRELLRFPALKGEKTWNCPALSQGVLYLRNSREMAAYDLKSPPDKKTSDAERPPGGPQRRQDVESFASKDR